MKVVVIGGGAAAFAGALHAAEQGAQVTLINAGVLGGTCINSGCLPSKMMIRGAQIVRLSASHAFHGIERHRPSIDLARHVTQRQALIDELRSKKYDAAINGNSNITLLRGTARFEDRRTLVVDTQEGETQRIEADRVLIATGAYPHIPGIPGLAEIPYWTSQEALLTKHLPNHLIIIGGSAVAVELGQAFQRLGSNVTLIARSTLLSRHDPAIGTALQAILESEGMSIITGTVPVAARFSKDIFSIKLPKGDLRGDALLVATGREPNTGLLDLQKAGVGVDSRGAIKIDRAMGTSVADIYAAGDCTDMPQLVYVAAAAGTRAATNMMGGRATLDPSLIPTVIFSDPQVASVGMTEAQAKRHGLAVNSRTLGLEQVPRALANLDTRGFIKLVADRNSGRLLGAHLVASNAGEIIQGICLAIQHKMTVRELGEQLYPYLTMSEGLKLCAQSFYRDVAHLPCCAG